jgi:hypothetical protein
MEVARIETGAAEKGMEVDLEKPDDFFFLES